jgi:hypothetical protein
MTPLLWVTLSAFLDGGAGYAPDSSLCLYWTQAIETRAKLEAAAIKQICVPPERAESWRAAGFSVRTIPEAELAAREALQRPGITPRPGVASPTRAPWIVANGWRFIRSPDRKYVYDVPAGKGALAAAESFAYGADVVLKIDPADLADVGKIFSFIEGVPAVDLKPVADIGVVDDGSPVTGEVMNLLARRNLLYQIVKTPSPQFRVNVAVGSPEFPLQEAADPSAFALKIRRQLSDDQRTLRIFGSEVVICRLTGDTDRAQLHLINYGGREIEGLRVRLRGAYSGDAIVPGAGRVPLADVAVSNGVTEFSIPKLGTYAIVDLRVEK